MNRNLYNKKLNIRFLGAIMISEDNKLLTFYEYQKYHFAKKKNLLLDMSILIITLISYKHIFHFNFLTCVQERTS